MYLFFKMYSVFISANVMTMYIKIFTLFLLVVILYWAIILRSTKLFLFLTVFIGHTYSNCPANITFSQLHALSSLFLLLNNPLGPIVPLMCGWVSIGARMGSTTAAWTTNWCPFLEEKWLSCSQRLSTANSSSARSLPPNHAGFFKRTLYMNTELSFPTISLQILL